MPSRLVAGEPPVLIDESQRYPASWDLVRRRVDDLLDAAVISTGHEAYRRQDGIGVIPAALLTA